LLLEDDFILSDILTYHLEKNNFNVVHVDNGEDALTEAYSSKFDLMILDINVPQKSGLEVLNDLRTNYNTTPIIVITAYQSTQYMKNSFDNGCDDYIKKPFDLEELDIRIENIKKRFSIENTSTISISPNISLIPTKLKIIINDKEHKLTQKECEILLYFNSHKKIVISSEELIRNLWDYEDMPADTTIRVYIKNLRLLLGKDAIKTIRGIGYSFE